MDPKQIADVITASVLATLRIALEQGALTEANLPAIARAGANNAASQLYVAAAAAEEAPCNSGAIRHGQTG